MEISVNILAFIVCSLFQKIIGFIIKLELMA